MPGAGGSRSLGARTPNLSVARQCAGAKVARTATAPERAFTTEGTVDTEVLLTVG